MVTKSAFVIFVMLVGAQRLYELSLSRRNERYLRSRGAVEHAPQQMPWMVAVHTLWMICTVSEVFVFERPFVWPVALFALFMFGMGQALRREAIRALGPRWTVKILTLPGDPAVAVGPFRYIRHPNYLGVALEIAALPLMHGAWVSAVVWSLANAVLLGFRIRAEEQALEATSDYRERFRQRPRFVPGR